MPHKEVERPSYALNYSQHQSLLTVIIQDILQSEPEQRDFLLLDSFAAKFHTFPFILVAYLIVG